jgi:two-component system sensor histidine kinase DesK
MDHLYAHRGEVVKDSQPNSGVLFADCDSGSATHSSLFEEIRAGEKGLRQQAFQLGRKRSKGRFFDFIWLVYSVFFVVDPLQRHSSRSWIAFGVAYALFLGIYIGLVFAGTVRGKLWLIAALGLLGIAYFPWNNGACGIFIYVAAFIPFVSEAIPMSVIVIALTAITMSVEGWLLHVSPWSWALCSFFAVSVGAANVVAGQKMRANRKLELAHEQIEHLAKVAERERIARDLHDVLGHTLSVVVLKSELAGKLLEREPDRARQEMGEVEQIARKALMEVREAIRGYRSEGLVAEIARAQKTLDAAGVTLECGAKPPQLGPAEETVLSLIVREAVTNIVRHAQASRCRLNFQAGEAGTALVVEDDGRGGIREEGSGLRGMRERVESIGGWMHIDCEQGTRLLVEIPRPDAVRVRT